MLAKTVAFGSNELLAFWGMVQRLTIIKDFYRHQISCF